MLEGLPELQELNMYGNKVAEIVVPRNQKLLAKLETLNLGYNDLAFLPDELDQIKSLRTLTLNNNYLEKVPMRVCEMDIKTIDVSSNPVIQPPTETCERGICSMKRYYHCLRAEAQNKHKALEEVQKKLLKNKKREAKKPFPKMGRFFSTKLSSGSKSFGDEGSPNATRSSVEEPIVLPSKAENRTLGRTRSVSFDELNTKAKNDSSEERHKGSAGAAVDFAENGPEIAIVSGDDVALGEPEDAVVNDTLKVVFVGMAMTGKTSMIKRLIEGTKPLTPKRDERTIGVDIYEWDPRNNCDRPQVDTRIEIEDEKIAKDVDVKLSVWDFAGQHVYHATHELFFSPHALYVVVWDMGATNQATHRRKLTARDRGAFRLAYDSSDEEDDDDFTLEEERRRADRALERDIDEKVQFWVECIQSCAPGAAILPVASFDDYFSEENTEEAKRRCNILKDRLMKHEERRVTGLTERLEQYQAENRASDEAAHRLRKLLCPYTRPKLMFGSDDSVVRVSGTEYTGFDRLTQRIVQLATGREKAGFKYPIFRGHVGAQIPMMRLQVRDAVREIREKFKVVE
jgi:GTPase SAR1 family protein